MLAHPRQKGQGSARARVRRYHPQHTPQEAKPAKTNNRQGGNALSLSLEKNTETPNSVRSNRTFRNEHHRGALTAVWTLRAYYYAAAVSGFGVYVRQVCVCATTKSSIIHLLQTYPPPGPFCTENAYTVLYKKKHLVLLLTLIIFYFDSISIICIFTPPNRAFRSKCLEPILHPTHYLR